MNASLDLISARSALNGGHPEVARTLLVDIVRADPSNGPAWHLLGLALTDPAQKADCQRRAAAAGYQAAPQELAPVAPQEPAAPVSLSFEPAASQAEFLPAAPFQPLFAPPQRAPINAVRTLMALGGAALALVLVLCVGAALIKPSAAQVAGGAPVAAQAGGDVNRTVYDECAHTVGTFLDYVPTISPYERSTVQKQSAAEYLVRGTISHREANGKTVTDAWTCTATSVEGGWMTVVR